MRTSLIALTILAAATLAAKAADPLTSLAGVATHYLPSYLGWRRMIERNSDLTPAAILIQALPHAAT